MVAHYMCYFSAEVPFANAIITTFFENIAATVLLSCAGSGKY
jgi:hypothetical protein